MRLLVILIAASFAACLPPTEAPREPNNFSLSITIRDAAQDYFVGNDTLTVIGYKMLIDTISVLRQGEEDERFEPSLRLASYVFGFADYYTIGTGSIGGGTYNGLQYSIVKPAPENANLNDPDLVERDAITGIVTDTYSISVSGVYNRNFFRFRSKISRTVVYDFLSSVRLPEVNAFLETRLRGNWKQWFINTAGNGILDPNDPNNKAQIEENILKHFDILTFTIGEVL